MLMLHDAQQAMRPATVVITGASKGIGRALALALPTPVPLVLVARSASGLDEVVRQRRAAGGQAEAVPADLSSMAASSTVGRRLAESVPTGTTLVHCAGIWPQRRELTDEGFERAYAVNHLGALCVQHALLASGRVNRVMAVNAGLIIKGRVDPDRTPQGADFSWFRTYCTTKLCSAIAMRDVAARHPTLDMLVLHPGVVRTDLGARSGPVGMLAAAVKRGWEAPEVCGSRLAGILAEPRWSAAPAPEAGLAAGAGQWRVEEKAEPWPTVTEQPETLADVRRITTAALGDW